MSKPAKFCKKCNLTKDSADFGLDRYRKGGLKPYCKTCTREANLIWTKNNPDKKKAARDKYYKNHRDRLIAVTAERRQAARDNKPNVRLRDSLRRRMNNALKNKQKHGSAIDDLGCSIEELMGYLESQFQPGMSWENYGQWHIDHIIPLSSYDLQDPTQLRKVCHFTNLQPLWAKENLEKGAKIE